MIRPSARVLIVDDEPDIIEILKYNLSSQGYQVYTAKNGVEGGEKAKKKQEKTEDGQQKPESKEQKTEIRKQKTENRETIRHLHFHFFNLSSDLDSAELVAGCLLTSVF